MVQLLVGKRGGRLVEGIVEPDRAQAGEVVLQDAMGGLEVQERVPDRHGEVAGGVVFFQFCIEVRGQDLVELGVQNCDGASLRAQEFFLQGDGVLQFAGLLQDFYGLRDHAPVMDQVHELPLDGGKAEELIRPVKQGQPQV